MSFIGSEQRGLFDVATTTPSFVLGTNQNDACLRCKGSVVENGSIVFSITEESDGIGFTTSIAKFCRRCWFNGFVHAVMSAPTTAPATTTTFSSPSTSVADPVQSL